MRSSPHNLWRVVEALSTTPNRIAGWRDASAATRDLTEWLASDLPAAPKDFVRRLIARLRADLVVGQSVFTTHDLVDVMSHVWQLRRGAVDVDYESWKPLFDAFSADAEVIETLPTKIAQALPFREEVTKLVYASLSGRMPFSREYVLRHYEQQHRGKPYVLFPADPEKVKRLVVVFSGHAGRKTYNRYSWYWDETECWSGDTARLFLCDERSHWYAGEAGQDDVEIWKELIVSTMKSLGLSASQVVTLGGSMGGYGAIRYAVELNLRAAIAVNAQLDFRAALRYKEDSWERLIRECGPNFRDIVDLVHRHGHRPILYLEHGQAACDLSGLTDVLQAVRDHGGMVIERSVASKDHQSDNPTRRQIEVLIDFVERFELKD